MILNFRIRWCFLFSALSTEDILLKYASALFVTLNIFKFAFIFVFFSSPSILFELIHSLILFPRSNSISLWNDQFLQLSRILDFLMISRFNFYSDATKGMQKMTMMRNVKEIQGKSWETQIWRTILIYRIYPSTYGERIELSMWGKWITTYWWRRQNNCRTSERIQERSSMRQKKCWTSTSEKTWLRRRYRLKASRLKRRRKGRRIIVIYNVIIIK